MIVTKLLPNSPRAYAVPENKAPLNELTTHMYLQSLLTLHMGTNVQRKDGEVDHSDVGGVVDLR